MVSDAHTASSDAGLGSAKTMPEPTGASPTMTTTRSAEARFPAPSLHGGSALGVGAAVQLASPFHHALKASQPFLRASMIFGAFFLISR